jgi:hypothetical protein
MIVIWRIGWTFGRLLSDNGGAIVPVDAGWLTAG